MSFDRGWKAINLEMTDKIPMTQYISHDEFILKKTGIHTEQGASATDIKIALAKALDYDWLNNICEMPMEGRYTKMGHASWSNTDMQNNVTECPFKDEEDVLNFDPVAEYGLADFDATVKTFQKSLDVAKIQKADVVFPGGRYNTLFSACIRTFGWDMFLSSIPHHEEEFDRVLEGFLGIALHGVKAWCKTDMKVYYNHDDITWTEGAVFPPEWYRRYIFPKYKRLWAPLKEKGIKIIYNADGNYTEFIDDIAEAGADGFMCEPTTSLEYLIEKYGKSKVIIGNVDCRILQFGTKEEIYKEVERCVNLGKNCPGYFMAVGNHIANGIPMEKVEYYFEVFEKLRVR